jgi:CubicO group peptidase (beta-lactamase class C family)
MRQLVLAGLALAAGSGALAAQRPDPRIRALDAYVEKTRVEWSAPAVGVAVVVGDSVVFAKGYGVREAGRPERADEHTVFAIGSSSKAFTTAALAMLVDEGRLRWDDRAADHLPGWALDDPWVTREIRVRDLVAHRVGLDRADRIWGGTAFSREEILHRQRHIERQESFRYRFGYNNHMYLAAGEVVRRVSGMTWDDFVTNRIFGPLGMTRARTSVKPLAGMANVATPHGWKGDSVVPIPWKDIDNIGPAGSINASAREMGEWLRLQLGGGVHAGRRLLSEAAVKEMHSPQTVIPIERWYASLSPVNHQMVPGTRFFMYGLGWFLQDYRGRYLVHHGGAIDGMRALVAMAPEERLGIVILTNQNPSNVGEAVMFRFFDLFFGAPERDWSREMRDSTRAFRGRMAAQQAALVAARVPGTAPSRPLAEYAGTYADSAYGDARVAEAAGRLTLEFGTATADLEHWHHDTFRANWRTRTGDWSLVTFRLDARGRPAEVVTGGMPPLRRREPRG